MKRKLNIIMIAIVFLTMFGLVSSCQSEDKRPTSTIVISTQKLTNTPEQTPAPIQTATPTITPIPSMDEMRTSIANALLTLYTKPNRQNSTMVFSDGHTRTNVIEFVPPDRKLLISDEGEDLLVVGEKVYSKLKTLDKWEESQIPASTLLGETDINAQGLSENISDVYFVRKDIFGGKEVIIYSYSSSYENAGVELHSRTEIWVGEEDGSPYKMIIDGEILSVSSDSQTGEKKYSAAKTLTTVLIEFDSNISIEPPNQ